MKTHRPIPSQHVVYVHCRCSFKLVGSQWQSAYLHSNNKEAKYEHGIWSHAGLMLRKYTIFFSTLSPGMSSLSIKHSLLQNPLSYSFFGVNKYVWLTVCVHVRGVQ
jgi:hypothetical protein